MEEKITYLEEEFHELNINVWDLDSTISELEKEHDEVVAKLWAMTKIRIKGTKSLEDFATARKSLNDSVYSGIDNILQRTTYSGLHIMTVL